MKTRLTLKRLLTIAPVFLLMTTFQSCTHYYYGPNANNIPLLKKSGDVRASLALATAAETGGVELQSAYAISNHVGAMLNFYRAGGSEGASKGSGTYIEGGAGYFKTLSEERIVLEAYGGAGVGSISNSDSYGSSKVAAQKMFVQPSIGFSFFDSRLEFAFACRFSHVSLKVTESTMPQTSDGLNDPIGDLKSNPNHFFIEPGFMIRSGFQKVKWQIQYTASKESRHQNYLTQPGIISIGMLFAFSKNE